MRSLWLSLSLFFPVLAFSGTANCDSDKHCQRLICPKLQHPYCAVIPDTTGPNGKPMGFCKCR